ncbi:hypothetical protein DFH11DRAFT_1773762 [Phellopilus nigrolimitatus]|nr:hypothetical protein DFH11DRAFT_1773762 [Phellopilus nigrolimitatus]
MSPPKSFDSLFRNLNNTQLSASSEPGPTSPAVANMNDPFRTQVLLPNTKNSAPSTPDSSITAASHSSASNIENSGFSNLSQGSYPESAPLPYPPQSYGPFPADVYQAQYTQEPPRNFLPQAPQAQPQPPSPSRKSMFDFVSPFDIVPILLGLLSRQDEDADEDKSNVSMAAATAADWYQREAAVMTFGSILDGPDPTVLTPLVTHALPILVDMTRDENLLIAGLRLLALVNDGTAVALSFGAGSFGAEREWHVVYDAGASGVCATVVSFAAAPTEGKAVGRNSTHIAVAGVGMAKLWKEAARVKTILSANTEASATVESIAFDINYRSKITRAALKTACVDKKPKFAQTIFFEPSTRAIPPPGSF